MLCIYTRTSVKRLFTENTGISMWNAPMIAISEYIIYILVNIFLSNGAIDKNISLLLYITVVIGVIDKTVHLVFSEILLKNDYNT